MGLFNGRKGQVYMRRKSQRMKPYLLGSFVLFVFLSITCNNESFEEQMESKTYEAKGNIRRSLWEVCKFYSLKLLNKGKEIQIQQE